MVSFFNILLLSPFKCSYCPFCPWPFFLLIYVPWTSASTLNVSPPPLLPPPCTFPSSLAWIAAALRIWFPVVPYPVPIPWEGVIFTNFLRPCVSLLSLLIFSYLQDMSVATHSHELWPATSLATHHSLPGPHSLHLVTRKYLRHPGCIIFFPSSSLLHKLLPLPGLEVLPLVRSALIHPLTQEAQVRPLSYVLASVILTLVTCPFSSWEVGMRRKIWVLRNANECVLFTVVSWVPNESITPVLLLSFLLWSLLFCHWGE